MNLSLSHEQEHRLEQLIKSGRFSSLEQFISYSLQTLDLEEELVKDEAYNEYLRGLLQEAQVAKREGRVVSIPEGQLANELKRRREAKQPSSKQNS
jgi:Arc/MetJ-type ribon-helix-helix transcriptional regulator